MLQQSLSQLVIGRGGGLFLFSFFLFNLLSRCCYLWLLLIDGGLKGVLKAALLTFNLLTLSLGLLGSCFGVLQGVLSRADFLLVEFILCLLAVGGAA